MALSPAVVPIRSTADAGTPEQIARRCVSPATRQPVEPIPGGVA